jgi:UDP-3-O-[3-hydroxymyristoyl] N-acetylglucosamine deacetylase / 3-hydroxyacyl-[acyl-carrier-protein] dehydratase
MAPHGAWEIASKKGFETDFGASRISKIESPNGKRLKHPFHRRDSFMFEYQKTLKKSARVQGVGLHTGVEATLTMLPAPANSGIRFARKDLPGSPTVIASVEHVKETQRGTTLQQDDVQVHTVEHVLAALAGAGVDNCLVELEGPEPPILDGSSREFSQAIDSAGTEKLSAKRNVFAPEAPIFYSNGQSSIVILPSDKLSISCSIHFPNQALENQHLSLDLADGVFAKELAPARTFCFYEEVKPLMDAGLIKGGSLECAVVIKGNEILSKEALRFRDEFVRHKMLDILGDITLLGPSRATSSRCGQGTRPTWPSRNNFWPS